MLDISELTRNIVEQVSTSISTQMQDLQNTLVEQLLHKLVPQIEEIVTKTIESKANNMGDGLNK